MQASVISLSNGETLFYVEKGVENKNQKPTILFIHGNLCSNICWYDLIDILQSYKYHIIAVDLRGFGSSTYNTKCNNFTDWASDLRQLCKLKNINKCIPVGWSFGGGISMKFAQIAPEIVSKLVLTCSVPHNGKFLKTKGVKCLTRQQLQQNQGAKFILSVLNTNNAEALKQIFKSLLIVNTPNYPDQKINSLINASLQMRCYIDSLYAMANSDIRIENIKAKVLMVHGKKDAVVPLDKDVIYTGQYFKNLVVLQNSHHFIPIEDVQIFTQLLTNFVNNQQ